MLNDYYQNIGMKGFIQRYGIVNAVKRGAFMFIKLHLVKDYEVRKVLWQERASTKIKPYLKYKDTDAEGLSFPENDVENPIWIYWNKGIEQAPIIIQKCYESVCKHSNQKIILLNDQNLADYIRLPDYIEKKKDAGQIPMAGYADLMRFALLEHYGGTYIALGWKRCRYHGRHTQFVEVLPNTGTSSRNQSVLELTGLTNRTVRDLNDFSYIDQEIDFKEANEKIGISRIESIRILEEMLTEQIGI